VVRDRKIISTMPTTLTIPVTLRQPFEVIKLALMTNPFIAICFNPVEK